MWQDTVLTIGSLVFIAALLPMVFGRRKPALSSALLTGSVLLVFSAAYASLSLTFAAVTTAVTAALWMTLAVQVMHRD